MRHLWSLLAGVAAAPVVWLLLATGQHRSQATIDGWDAAGAYDTADLIGPAIILIVAGVLLGVLGTLRWSPAGPVAAGVLLVLPTAVVFANPFQVMDNLADSWRLLGQDLAPRLPIENGTMLVLGALLLMAAFSAQRWRRWPVADAPAPANVASDPEARQPMTDEEILADARALGGEQAPESAGEPDDTGQPASTGEPDDTGGQAVTTAPADQETGAPDPAPHPTGTSGDEGEDRPSAT